MQYTNNNLRLKVKLIIIFILLSVPIFYMIEKDSRNKIDLLLKDVINNLSIHYLITTDNFINDASSSMKSTLLNNQYIIEILKEAQNATESHRKILRKKLYNLLLPKYRRMTTRGVLQLHFVFPDNKSFLRMHKPEKFGDDLTGIRYSYEYANREKKDIYGFEQGRVAHSFRYVFPFFDKKGNHLGAAEISLSTGFIQKKLSELSKIHTHFLVDKGIFDIKTHQEKNLVTKYIPSLEHPGYMYSIQPKYTDEELGLERQVLKNIKNDIAYNISLKKPFAVHTKYENKIKVIAFLPIKNIKDKKVVAYLVSYTDNQNIYNINIYKYIAEIMTFIGMLLIAYFIYKNIIHKEELDAEVKKLRQAQEVAKIGSWQLNAGESKLTWSDETYKIFGIDKTVKPNVILEDFFSAIHPEDLQHVSYTYNNHLQTQEPYHIIHRLLLKDGTIKYVEEKCGTVFDDDGNPLVSTGTVQDITVEELLRIENDKNNRLLTQQSKMAALGEMLGNIAHQWRQPLTVISSNASGLKFKKELDMLNDNEFEEICDSIVKNTRYLSDTIDDFSDFIKGDKVFKEFSLKETIEKNISFLQSSLKTNFIDIVYDIKDDIKVYGYQNELIQVLMNIINNAKDALLDKEDDRFIFISIYKNNNFACISIKDNAFGIKKDVIDKIFEPYFTTKHQSLGTGLGLYMSYNIIKSMNGEIEVQNSAYDYTRKEFTGAEFIIKLPL